MIRKALEVLGWGIVAVLAVVFATELILSKFDSVHISAAQWALLAIGILIGVFSHKRDEVLTQHLPH